MAKVCLVCGSWCAYFLIFLRITLVLSINDNCYNYHVDSLDDHWLDFKSLDSRHILEKRDVNNVPIPSTTAATEVPPASSVAASTEISNATTNKTEVPVKSKSPKLTKTAPTTATTNITTKQILKTPIKNLGVNGTGQRKMIPPTSKPIIVPTVEPILLHNDTSVNDMMNQTSSIPDIDEDISISKFSENDAELNKTITLHNITVVREDHHLYYNSTLRTDPESGEFYWIDLSNRSDVKVNELLSRSHRRAATVKLKFEFPFYGHLIKNVTIATGGFLYTGDYVHSWLAATQYIAPLMANFDTSISNESFIRYMDNGTAFTVEWEKVVLQDKPNEGNFTFQTTLHKNGDIVFVYKNVPPFITQIEDDHHPVKIGLSDAYIIDRTIFFVRRKTIYEYDRVNFQKEDIKNGTVIYLKALPTCMGNKDCTSCLNLTTFKCDWCPTTNRCSNGFDRNRQDWLMKNCEKRKISNETMCAHITSTDIYDKTNMTYSHDNNEYQELENNSKVSRMYDNSAIDSGLISNQPVQMGVSGIIAILFLLAMIVGLGFWVIYAYRNPHTTSGQILIRYRPSQWRWKRGEARYTAATIHM